MSICCVLVGLPPTLGFRRVRCRVESTRLVDHARVLGACDQELGVGQERYSLTNID